MYERTDGSSYKRPNEESEDAGSAIADRNKEINNLLDDPNATSTAPTPAPTPEPTATPEQKELVAEANHTVEEANKFLESPENTFTK